MYRFFALAFIFTAVACGGGGSASNDPTATNPPAGNTTAATQQVAGERTQTPTSPTAQATPPGSYEVVDGDTLSDIASRFNTTVEALVAANGLANADELTIGQVLKIATPTPETLAATSPTATATAQ